MNKVGRESLGALVATSALSVQMGAFAADDAPWIELANDAACRAATTVPRLVEYSPVVLSDLVWEQKPSWEAQVRFRLDEGGKPILVRAAVSGSVANHGDLEDVTEDTLKRYRFCLPADFSPRSDWGGRMRFSYWRAPDALGGSEVMLQSFIPTYERDDVIEKRAGVTRVAAKVGPDGRPIAVRITSSSGDRTLDQKSLDSMSTLYFAFRGGSAFARPLTFERPYAYTFR